jgi:hypothetical protein
MSATTSRWRGVSGDALGLRWDRQPADQLGVPQTCSRVCDLARGDRMDDATNRGRSTSRHQAANPQFSAELGVSAPDTTAVTRGAPAQQLRLDVRLRQLGGIEAGVGPSEIGEKEASISQAPVR